MNIYIIGLPGSGKKTIGKRLAEKLNYKYVDIDKVIEQKENLFIEDVYDKKGSDYVRDLETSLLKETLNENQVITCNAGIVKRVENKDLMKGIKLYLDTDVRVIKSRLLKDDKDRPLLKVKTLEELYAERYEQYRNFADGIVSNNHDIEETINVIINYLKNMKVI